MIDGYDTEEQAIEAVQAQAIKDGGVDYFYGMTCNDYDDGTFCSGWDGESRRCDCGNRRVGWIASQLSTGKWTAYAEAY